MEITCTPNRLYAEPLRLILQAARISYTETASSEDSKRMTLYNHDSCVASEYDEVVQVVSSSFFNSDKWLASTNDSTSEAIALNNKLLPQIQALYLEIADCVASESSLSSFSESSLRQYTRAAADTGFIAGNKWTPVDAFFYEIIKTLEAKNIKTKDSGIYKYIERTHAVKELKCYIFSSDAYMRPFTGLLKSTVATRQDILQKKLQSFCYFAMSEGLMMAHKKDVVNCDEQVEFADHMPFNCYPKRISKEEIFNLKNIQQHWNVLLNSMARNFDWISEKLKDMAESEEFVRRLYEIAKKCRAYPHTQKVALTVSRNDYMYNSKDNRWLQVEYNMIAAGLMPSSDSVQKLHKHITQNYFNSGDLDFEKSENLAALQEALVAGYNAYGNKDAIALLIVPATYEHNMFDQRRVEKCLFEKGIECLRLTLEEVYNSCRFDESTGKLYVQEQEVGLVYFRAGYIPDHYPNEETWKARELIELSQAVKCPNVDNQLINFKIFQVYLAKDEVLAEFVPDVEQRKMFQKNFAKFWDFEDPSKTSDILQMVEANPCLYVLKPQREGGANNYFGKDIIHMMKTLSPEDLSTYLLMERIDSAPSIGYFVRNKKMDLIPCTSELGIFAYVLSDEEKIIQSKVAGALVRSKPEALCEGGLAKGYGVIDSFVYE